MSAEAVLLWRDYLKGTSPSCVAPGSWSDNAVVEPADFLTRAILHHFRCPADLFAFEVEGKTASYNEGYFRFGANAICYGRSTAAVRQFRSEETLRDVIKEVSRNNRKIEIALQSR